ncbi:MAG: response regulator transcription factor [Chloroflexi bacterium]|nr:response regulator transcription factor [Chloroflexota bacterium]
MVHPRNDRETGRKRVLLVDDERTLTELVAHILEAEGYDVRAVGSGREAEAALDEYRPDLIILDIMLPDTDGLMLCTQLQARWPAPVIMLSGSRRERDRVLSLRLGADDFIAKPFDTLELVARVEAVLRRATGRHGQMSEARSQAVAPSARASAASTTSTVTADAGGVSAPAPQPSPSPPQRTPQSPEPTRYQVGALTIDLRRRVVAINGTPVHLTPTENRLLSTLASEPERVFSRDELAEVLWGYDSLGESRAVDVHIRRLRAKLEPFGVMAPPIITVRGFGYRLGSADQTAATA